LIHFYKRLYEVKVSGTTPSQKEVFTQINT